MHYVIGKLLHNKEIGLLHLKSIYTLWKILDEAEFILERKRFFIALSHAHFCFLRSKASYR